MKSNLEFHALTYLNQWLSIERDIYRKVHSNNKETVLEGISDGAKHFRIARTLPTKFEEEESKKRYEPVLEIIFDDFQLNPTSHVSKLVAQKHSELSESYGGRTVISATTKFLWLKYRNPIRILDSQAKNTLGIKTNEYREFTTKWDEQYSRLKERISEASKKLPALLDFAFDPTADIVEISQSDWFQQRVFDNYLWFNG